MVRRGIGWEKCWDREVFFVVWNDLSEVCLACRYGWRASSEKFHRGLLEKSIRISVRRCSSLNQ